MQKYNFYNIKEECIRIKDDKIVKIKGIPEDVNQPVHDMIINDLKEPEISKLLRKMEKYVRCGDIQIFFKKVPKFIKIKVNYGMVAINEFVEEYDTKNYSCSIVTQIKNTNLSMRKPKWLTDKIKDKRMK